MSPLLSSPFAVSSGVLHTSLPRPGRALLALALVLMGVLGLSAASAQAAFPGTNGKIAYMKYSTLSGATSSVERQDIWSMNPDGSGDTDLTNTAVFPQPLTPAYSADGTTIAYGSNNSDIWVMNADGSGQHDITNTPNPDQRGILDEQVPAFSPDGTKIAYQTGGPPSGDAYIFVMNADGTDARLLTRSGTDTNPTFSPDGTKIAFVRNTPSPPYAADIWVMNADGTNQHAVATGSDACLGLDYSPDGTKFVYADCNLGEVRVISSDGMGSPSHTGAINVYLKPVFSPDGTKIAYSGDPDPPDTIGRDSADISVMNVDGSNKTDVTPAGTRDPFPVAGGNSYELDLTWGPIAVVPAPAPAPPPPSTTPPPANTTPPPAGTTPPPADTTPPPAGTPPDTTAPVFGALALSPSSFRAAGFGASITATVGTRVSYTLSEAAAVRFQVQRASSGRLAGGRCVRPTASNITRKRCTRYVTLPGTFTHQGRAGTNRFRFSPAGRKLTTGQYRLRGVASDAATNRSLPRQVGFRIVRP